jgi:competence ComEA-like helix-hairpin-helix protein
MHDWGRLLARAAARITTAIGFTAGEQRLVLFLVGAFFVGLALKLIGVGDRPAAITDYRQLDSEFAARSRGLGVDSAVAGTPAAAADTMPAAPRGGPVDLNRAQKNELMTLPGIGPTLADRIVAYRVNVARFRSVSDLLKVQGIGRKKLERLAPLCTVK